MSAARKLRIAVVAAAAALAAAAPADARYSRAEAAFGPTPDVVALGGVDLSQDGTGSLAFLRREPAPLGIGSEVGVWSSRLDKGSPTRAVRVNPDQRGVAYGVQIAVGDRHRAVAVWLENGSLWGSRRPGKRRPWSPPQRIFAGSPLNQVRAPSLDVSVFGTAHVAFTVGGDVRAARMPYQTGTWRVIPRAVDIGRANFATDPDVATSADGTAVIGWTETASGAASKVFLRRVTERGQLSAFPREASLRRLRGRLGGAADSPDVTVQSDSSFAFVAWRQDFAGSGGTASRALARRLRASRLETARSIDGRGFAAGGGAAVPQIYVGGRGEGVAATALASGRIVGAGIGPAGVLGTRWFRPARLDRGGNAGPPPFTTTTAEEPSGVVAWQRGTGNTASIQARRWNGRRFVGLRTLSPRSAGPSAATLGIDSAADSRTDFVVSFVQGAPATRRVMVVAYAGPLRPAGVLHARAEWRRTRRPLMRWRPLRNVVWGPVTFQVVLDGRVIHKTRRSKWRPRKPLPRGKHVVEIRQVDGRGQVHRGLRRPLWLGYRPRRSRARRSSAAGSRGAAASRSAATPGASAPDPRGGSAPR